MINLQATFTSTKSTRISVIEGTWFTELTPYLHKDYVCVYDEGIPLETLNVLQTAIPETQRLGFPGGEASKSWETLAHFLTWLETQDTHPTTTVIVIGGGALLDAIGFASSLYMRGLPLVFIPTTLLAMVDAAIGGKTAINRTAKNQLGTFYPAQHVLVDTHFIKDLPPTLFQEGMAEIIKIASVLDGDFFAALATRRLDVTALLVRAIQLKVAVVENDLYDQGNRRLLNFGHTFGHALERYVHYQIPHGRCVAEGMLVELTGSPFLRPVQLLLNAYGILTPLQYDIAAVLPLLRYDKKRDSDRIEIITLSALGQGQRTWKTFQELTTQWQERNSL